jgi:Uncharacterised nucleotidyltransferase
MLDVHIGAPKAQDVAAFGLRTDGGEPVATSIPAPDWSAFLGPVLHQRLTGMAVAAAESGGLALTEDQWLELVDEHRAAMLLCLALERELLGIGRVLDEAGVPFVVVKGPAVAHTLYPDPSWRSFGDLDLLVRTQDWRAACEGLRSRGSRRRFAEPRPGFTERFGKGALHMYANHLEVDLHRMIADAPFGYWMDVEELFDASATFRVGDVVLRRFDDSALLLHACLHAVLGHTPPLLLPLRDVVQASRSPGVDWRKVSDWAERWRLRAVIRRALELAGETFEVDMPDGAGSLLRSMIPDQQEIRALRAYILGVGRRGTTQISSLRAIPRIRDRFAFAAALLVPSREFVIEREGGTVTRAYLRRWTAPIRSALKR